MEAMPDCLFCKIASGKIPSKVVLQDDEMFAFDDVNPQAPVHVLVIPKRHIGGLNDAGREGGQTVFHLHVHVLGGRQMTWPPG